MINQILYKVLSIMINHYLIIANIINNHPSKSITIHIKSVPFNSIQMIKIVFSVNPDKFYKNSIKLIPKNNIPKIEIVDIINISLIKKVLWPAVNNYLKYINILIVQSDIKRKKMTPTINLKLQSNSSKNKSFLKE